jgi:mRNA degradation ribonuclease J1/J2
VQELDAPVYTTRLTRSLIEVKLRGAPSMHSDVQHAGSGQSAEVLSATCEFPG